VLLATEDVVVRLGYVGLFGNASNQSYAVILEAWAVYSLCEEVQTLVLLSKDN